MQIQSKKKDIIIGKPYAGKIVSYSFDKEIDILALFVRIYGKPKKIYKYNVKVDVTPESDFLKFCFQIGVRDMKNDEIDLEDFLNMDVICEIAEDDKGNKYVDFIDNLWWNCYTNEEEFQEVFNLTDDEMLTFYHQGVKKIVWSDDEKCKLLTTKIQMKGDKS